MTRSNYDIASSREDDPTNGFGTAVRHDSFSTDVLTDSGIYCRYFPKRVRLYSKDYKGVGSSIPSANRLDGSRAISLRIKTRFDSKYKDSYYTTLHAKAASEVDSNTFRYGYNFSFFHTGYKSKYYSAMFLDYGTPTYNRTKKIFQYYESKYLDRWTHLRMDIIPHNSGDTIKVYRRYSSTEHWVLLTTVDSTIPWDHALYNSFGFSSSNSYVDGFEIYEQTEKSI